MFNVDRTENVGSIILVTSCLIGILGNLGSIYICMRNRLQRIPLFAIMTTKSIMDILALSTLTFYSINLYIDKYKIYHHDLELCRISLFTLFWSFQTSAYLLVRN